MVSMWIQFLEYVKHKDIPMADGDWCEEALAFSGGNPIVASALLDMVKASKAVDSMVKHCVPGEA